MLFIVTPVTHTKIFGSYVAIVTMKNCGIQCRITCAMSSSAPVMKLRNQDAVTFVARMSEHSTSDDSN